MGDFFRRHIYLLLILLLAFVVRCSIVFVVYHGDVYNHIAWGKYAVDYGFNGIYEKPFNLPTAYEVNQPPGTIYIFAAMRWVYLAGDKIVWFLNNHIGLFPSRFVWFYDDNFYPALLKLPAMVADLGIGILLYCFGRQFTTKKRSQVICALFLFNPLTFYNSALWGQTDATVNFFGLLAFYLLMRHRLFWALAALATSLFIKASLAIYVPLFIVILLKQKYQLKQTLWYCLLIGLTIFVVTLPFHQLSDPFWFIRTYVNIVVFGSLNFATENAFNLWALVFGIQPKVVATTPVLGLSATLWGYLIFLIVLIPSLYRQWRHNTVITMLENLVLLGFSAYLFLTGMHERYLYPIFAPFALLTLFKPKYIWLYVACSFIHLANLYNLWWAPTIDIIKYFMETTNIVTWLILGLFACYGIFIAAQFSYKKVVVGDSVLHTV